MCEVVNVCRKVDKFCLKKCDMIIDIDVKTSVIEDFRRKER